MGVAPSTRALWHTGSPAFTSVVEWVAWGPGALLCEALAVRVDLRHLRLHVLHVVLVLPQELRELLIPAIAQPRSSGGETRQITDTVLTAKCVSNMLVLLQMLNLYRQQSQ